MASENWFDFFAILGAAVSAGGDRDVSTAVDLRGRAAHSSLNMTTAKMVPVGKQRIF
jgi:hypothetical protein